MQSYQQISYAMLHNQFLYLRNAHCIPLNTNYWNILSLLIWKSLQPLELLGDDLRAKNISRSDRSKGNLFNTTCTSCCVFNTLLMHPMFPLDKRHADITTCTLKINISLMSVSLGRALIMELSLRSALFSAEHCQTAMSMFSRGFLHRSHSNILFW